MSVCHIFCIICSIHLFKPTVCPFGTYSQRHVILHAENLLTLLSCPSHKRTHPPALSSHTPAYDARHGRRERSCRRSLGVAVTTWRRLWASSWRPDYLWLHGRSMIWTRKKKKKSVHILLNIMQGALNTSLINQNKQQIFPVTSIKTLIQSLIDRSLTISSTETDFH